MANDQLPILCNSDDGVFFRILYRRAHAYQGRYLPPGDTDDCVQNFVLKLWVDYREDLEKYRQGALPEAWFRVCAENAAKSVARRKRAFSGRDLPISITDDIERTAAIVRTHDISLEDRLIKSELITRLELTLSGLSETSAGILRRHYFEGETWVAIAMVYNSTPDGVRMKARRALRKMRSILEAFGLTTLEADDYLRK